MKLDCIECLAPSNAQQLLVYWAVFKSKVRHLSTPFLFPEEKCRTGSSDFTLTPRIIKPETTQLPERVQGACDCQPLPSLTHPSPSHCTALGSALATGSSVKARPRLLRFWFKWFWFKCRVWGGRINARKRPKTRSPKVGLLVRGGHVGNQLQKSTWCTEEPLTSPQGVRCHQELSRTVNAPGQS